MLALQHCKGGLVSVLLTPLVDLCSNMKDLILSKTSCLKGTIQAMPQTEPQNTGKDSQVIGRDLRALGRVPTAGAKLVPLYMGTCLSAGVTPGMGCAAGA